MRRRIYICLIGAFFIGCTSLHERVKPAELNGPATPQLRWTHSTGSQQTTGSWWATFNDPKLTQLVATMHDQNLDLKQAVQRIKQARAVLAGAAAAAWPTVEANASAQQGRANTPFGIVVDSEQYGASVGAAYEIDAWNKLGARRKASDYNQKATILEQQALAMSLTAQLVDLYFAYAEQLEIKRLLSQQLHTNQVMLTLLKQRFGYGLAQATDVLQQEQNTKALQALIAPLDAQRDSVRNQIATMLGTVAIDFSLDEPDHIKLPVLSGAPQLGVPADLLTQRPDLRAIQLRIKASDENVAAAIADRLPAFRIRASAGYGARSFSDLLDQWLWSITGSVVAPLFDGGRRAAEVDRMKAIVEETLLEFKKRYLVAIADVETALASEQGQRARLSALRAELKTARVLLRETKARYLDGLLDYLPVLNALQATHRAERNVVAARRQLLIQRVALHRAIGGHWVSKVRLAEQTGDKE
ncbi:MAG: efflux transporter outer membrane subunit [Myxococcota bacterium]|nr:efflux transporter outer membrane subunit [Myxococcota bacterium]